MTMVIGLIGQIGSGKTQISHYLQKNHGAVEYRFSRILTDVLDRLYLPHKREYLQKLGVSLRADLGGSVIVDAMKKDMEKEKSGLIVLDGIRYKNEIEMLRSFVGSVLIYVYVSPETRYERVVERNEKGEGEISFARFLENEKAETEKMIEELGKMADVKIHNSKSIDELHIQIEEILKRKK